MVLDEAADAARQRQLCEFGELRLDRLAALHRHGRDHSGDARVELRLLAYPARLVKILAVGHVDLDENELFDFDPGGQAGIILRQIGLVEEGDAGHPGIGKNVRVVEVDVGVDDRKIGQGRSS
jgi:hypothetical protein